MLHSEPWPERYQKPSPQSRTQNIWFAFTVGDSRSGPQKNLPFQMPASCRRRLHSHPADHIRGRCQGGEPSSPCSAPHNALGHQQPARPHTSNRLTNYSQIKLIRAPRARCRGGRNYSAVRKIRLSGEWLPQMIIISSALVPPKQTLS